jgi:hypothetical protein
MKISTQAPEGFDPLVAPHRIILEAENDSEIATLLELLNSLVQKHEKSPIVLPRSDILQ